MKTKRCLFLLLFLGSSAFCFAQTAEDLGASRRSAYDDFSVQRDPFLPIGWTKPQPVQVTRVNGAPVAVPIESYIRPEAFVVSSISFDRIPLAVINGKPCAEGDTFPFNAGGTAIKLQVYAIRDGAVTLSYNDFKVVCPIKMLQKPAAPKK